MTYAYRGNQVKKEAMNKYFQFSNNIKSRVARPFFRAGRYRLEMISARAKRVWNSSQARLGTNIRTTNTTDLAVVLIVDT